jgi:iron complex outermembrane recepter protein
MRVVSFLILLFFAGSAIAQDTTRRDTSHYLNEFVVTGFQKNDTRHSSLNIEPYTLAQMNEKSPYNLSDALAKLPGISQMTSGNAISKPVIRGLYGNRILVLFSGMRFDNQQFQDEHGLGLSQIGIDRVEMIKGPASLLYGSDALGGVINVIEEKPMEQGKHLDAGTQLFSNTMGTLTDAGYSSRKGNNWWRLRLGAESHADYSDGHGTRVLDSRNKGYYLKAGMGFEKAKWTMENSYNFSYNQFGFIIDDLGSFFKPDDRWSRSMKGPHHNVMLNLFSSQNTFFLPTSLLKLNVGVQSNKREEDEGGGQISLNMHLLSVLESMRWEKDLSNKVSFVANEQFTLEENTNYGKRILVPDATFIEENVSGYFRFLLNKLVIETGVGISDKYIKTIKTNQLNPPGSPVAPFSKNDVTGNGMLGAAYNPNEWLTLKTNASTGFRSPNLAELSSNGLHEGVYRYEVGDPNLKIEQNLNTDLMLEVNRPQWVFSVSAYHTRFFNYIYLSSTGESYYGFPVYHFMQQNARIYGAECWFNISPKALKGIEFKGGFSATRGELDDSGKLPFIPAFKVNGSVRYEKKLKGKVSSVFFEPEYVYVFDQNDPARFETATAAYYLLNFTSGVTVKAATGNWTLGVTGTNLTNNAYMDHLSRLKYYGLLNQGINFVVSARKDFKW